MESEKALPEGWSRIKIRDVFESWSGATPSTSNPEYWNGTIPWVSSKDVKQHHLADSQDHITAKALSETRLRLAPKGSVLVVVRSGILRHTLPVAVADVDVTINQDLKAFHTPEQSLNEWLAVVLRARSSEILGQNRKDGTTVESIGAGKLQNLEIDIPPLAEQRRIVARLEVLLADLERVRGRLDAVAATMQRFRQAVLVAACGGVLTERWRQENDGIPNLSNIIRDIEREFKDLNKKTKQISNDGSKELQQLPKKWIWVNIGNIAIVDTGTTPYRKNPRYWDNGTIPWVTSGAVNNDYIYSASEFVTEEALKETRLKVFPKHTLLIALYGEGQTRGKCSELMINATINQACASINFSKSGDELRPFVKLFLKKNYEDIRKESSGGVQPNLNLSKIKSTQIPLPPVAEQHEIVRRVDALFALADRIEGEVAGALEHVEALREAVLAKAFRGELVPTEAELARREGREYEPASALLERVRAERQGNPPKTRGRMRGAAGQCRLAVD